MTDFTNRPDVPFRTLVFNKTSSTGFLLYLTLRTIAFIPLVLLAFRILSLEKVIIAGTHFFTTTERIFLFLGYLAFVLMTNYTVVLFWTLFAASKNRNVSLFDSTIRHIKSYYKILSHTKWVVLVYGIWISKILGENLLIFGFGMYFNFIIVAFYIHIYCKSALRFTNHLITATEISEVDPDFSINPTVLYPFIWIIIAFNGGKIIFHYYDKIEVIGDGLNKIPLYQGIHIVAIIPALFIMYYLLEDLDEKSDILRRKQRESRWK